MSNLDATKDKSEPLLIFSTELNDLPVSMGGTTVHPYFVESVNILSDIITYEEAKNRLQAPLTTVWVTSASNPELPVMHESFYQLFCLFQRFVITLNRRATISLVKTIFGENKTSLTEEERYYTLYTGLNFNDTDYVRIRKELKSRDANYDDEIISFDTLKQINDFMKFLIDEGQPISRLKGIKYALSIDPAEYCSLKNNYGLSEKAIYFLINAGFTEKDTILHMHDCLPPELYEV